MFVMGKEMATTMTIPGFSAEASLGGTTGVYWTSGAPAPLAVVTQALSGPAAASFFNPFPLQRCCRVVPHYGLVCVYRYWSPIEFCTCQTDFLGFPIFLCHPPVLAQGIT
jgi:hypothetical protein